MRYAIVGGGALGGFYGILLEHAGCEVHWLLRSEYAEVAAHGWRMRSPRGTFHIPQVKAYSDPARMPPCDVVLWCTKATANPTALPAILPHVLAPGGLTVLMQNGLGNEEEAAALVPHGAFHAGLCFLCSNRTAPGEIHHLEYGDMLIGPPAGAPHPHLARLRADLARAGIENELERDVPTARWRKLCWNIPFNGLCGLDDSDTAQILDDHGRTALVEALMREVVAGATACGHRLPPDLPQKMLARTHHMPPYLPSLVFDLRLGREPELEHLYRRPIAAATAAGCPMPHTADLLTLLESRARRAAACA